MPNNESIEDIKFLKVRELARAMKAARVSEQNRDMREASDAKARISTLRAEIAAIDLQMDKLQQ